MNAVATARELLRAGRRDAAIGTIREACQRNDGGALFEMAIWLLIGDPVPRDVASARSFLSRARVGGQHDAALVEIALIANGSGAAADFAGALRLLRNLAPVVPIAAAQLALIDAMNLQSDGRPRTLPVREQLNDAPGIWRYRNLLSQGECLHLANATANLLEPALIADPHTGRMVPHPIRTSSSAMLGPTREDLVVRAINLRLAAASETDVAQGEALTVLRYAPGEEYRLHLDTLPATRNQRMRTALVYLNQGFGGGETQFPDLNVTVTPGGGDVLIFDNLNQSGRPELKSRHAGLPLVHGVKWLATRWIRERAFDPWRGPDALD